MRLKLLLIITFLIASNGFCISTPLISANALFLYRNSNFHKEDTDTTTPGFTPDQERNGINVREAELQFDSDVDPYNRLSLLLSIHPQYELNGTNVEEKWIVEPEEAFVESNVVPDVTFKIGKFKAAMGKQNTLHTHAFLFIDQALQNSKLLGDEGLNDVGLSAAALLPTAWFSEVTLQYLRGEGENTEFKSATPGDGVGLIHWKNLFDLSDALTMEIGGSFAGGANSLRGTTSIAGADVTFKWRPTEGGRYQSLIWASEFLSRKQTQAVVNDEKASGFESSLQYQFAERWAGLYRFDTLTVKDTFDPANLPDDTYQRHSVGLAYIPSEFSQYKLEFDRKTGGPVSATGEKTENTVFLQANFTIGAHPAHSY